MPFPRIIYTKKAQGVNGKISRSPCSWQIKCRKRKKEAKSFRPSPRYNSLEGWKYLTSIQLYERPGQMSRIKCSWPIKCYKRKKIGLPNPQVGSEGAVALKHGGQFGYSIADLIKDVKNIFPDTFSTDVYDHFNMQRGEQDSNSVVLSAKTGFQPHHSFQMSQTIYKGIWTTMRWFMTKKKWTENIK